MSAFATCEVMKGKMPSRVDEFVASRTLDRVVDVLQAVVPLHVNLKLDLQTKDGFILT